MTLREYHQKRNFKATPEPDGEEEVQLADEPMFVVQKHKASHLHYDFRLEVDGVLKSWAIPKGPTLDTNAKRLAVKVEDHPLSYGHFEGTIPEGNYGAGEVIVWDTGTYRSAEFEDDEFDAKENQKKIRAGLRSGQLKFTLNGKKLKGNFALVKLKNVETGKSWILIKEGDEYAQKMDISKDSTSAISDRVLEG